MTVVNIRVYYDTLFGAHHEYRCLWYFTSCVSTVRYNTASSVGVVLKNRLELVA